MKLTVIGSGTSVIRKERASSSFLLQAGGKLLLFDCGWGVPTNLLRARVSPQELDHVFITHPHNDHMGGLISILHSILNSGVYFPQTKRKKPLFLHGYQGFNNDYEKLRNIMFPERVDPYQIKIFEYLETTREINGFKIQSCQSKHHPKVFNSVSFRLFYRGKVFFYSGDTGFSEDLIDLARGADLAILEASVSVVGYRKKGPRPNHLSFQECGMIAQKAQVKKLILTHLYDNSPVGQIRKEVGENFKGELIIAKDLQTLDV